MTTLARPAAATTPQAARARARRSGRLTWGVVWALVAGWTIAFSWLSILRHEAFYTGRFDLGNMMQAAWTTGRGELLTSTDLAGDEISRLSVHVDPLLALFAPVIRVWPSPEILLIAQAAAVALGAVPIALMARRWHGDGPLVVAFAAAWLLFPPLQWAVVTEFHPVTLAAPLLAGAIWAADAGRLWWLAGFSGLALVSKEQVGLSLVVLGIWMAIRGRRRAGAVLAGVSGAWVAIAVGLVIPLAGDGAASPLSDRYSRFGDGPAEVAATLLLRPWEAPQAVAGDWRYGASLFLPLLLLPLAAPLLAAGALPDTALNLLSSHAPQHEISFHYVAVSSPFLLAGAVVGLARLRGLIARRLGRGAWTSLRRPRVLAGAIAGAGVFSGFVLGPLPIWSHVPGGSDLRVHEYRVTPHARALARAVERVPDRVPVSASNHIGAHVSARQKVYLFPVVEDAQWVVIDVRRAPFGLEVGPIGHALGVAAFATRRDFRQVFAEDGALVYRRVGGT